MTITAEQVKGRIKSMAIKNNADAIMLLRIYMMERFLERLSVSKYKDNFIIKGGTLVTAMVGISLRSTMDIDASIKNQNLSKEDALKIINEIINIDINDGVSFKIKELSKIMDDMEYPGIRFTMDAIMGKMITPIKIDISTGDIVTPKEIEFSYKLILEERSISLFSYNLETILAEKLQTILSRGILNTRMRDYYDIDILFSIYKQDIDKTILKEAFDSTCHKRKTEYLKTGYLQIIHDIEKDKHLNILWKKYQTKYSYASNISYSDIIFSIKEVTLIIFN